MDAKEIDRRFSYHPPPNEETVALYEEIRERARGLAHLLNRVVPDFRSRALALTKLEEVVMHANAGIARPRVEEHRVVPEGQRLEVEGSKWAYGKSIAEEVAEADEATSPLLARLKGILQRIDDETVRHLHGNHVEEGG